MDTNILTYIVTHTFDIVIAVFELSQNIVHQSAGVINGNTVLDFNAIIGNLTEQLENMEVGDLFLLLIGTSSVVYITLFMYYYLCKTTK